jgi:hypothetical protein
MMRRWTIPVLAVVLGISVCGWIFYIPPAALNSLRAVPEQARPVYRSAAPDWSALEKLPVSRDWKNLPGIFQTLEKSPFVLAVAPLGGRDRRDAWIAVSAAGPRAFLLRWKLTLFPPNGIREIKSYGAWPVWQVDDPSLPVWMRVRFSLTEGLLICSISDNSHDIYYLLDTLDGRRPAQAD